MVRELPKLVQKNIRKRRREYTAYDPARERQVRLAIKRLRRQKEAGKPENTGEAPREFRPEYQTPRSGYTRATNH